MKDKKQRAMSRLMEIAGNHKYFSYVSCVLAATETYLAHNLPDKVVSRATPVGLLVMMAVFDWRLGLLSLIPAVLAFLIMGSLMMGPKMAEDMKHYQNSLETMSSEAVEYIRGVPVLKTFGQTIFSFKRFKSAIDDYEKWTLDYTKSMMLPMICFTVLCNGIFAALIVAVYVFGGNTVTDGQEIKDASVVLKEVTFAYDESKGNVIDGISIARAFLKDAPIILMDEATASLDVDNESVIQESISKLIENKTVLIIAHRMRTVDGVDKIVVLKDGVVAEQGTPQELKSKDSIYRHMVETQLETEQWKYQ